MDPKDQEIAELRGRVQELTQRVYRLEQRVGVQPETVAAPAPTSPPASVDVVAEQPVVSTPPPVAPYPVVPPVAPKPRVQTASLESRIGSQWLNRVGIIAVLIGVSYFLKFAFDNNWIGPAGRIAIGLLAGIGVIAWSEMFRSRGYNIFSYSLKAIGVGTLYLSLWAGFQLYHLFPAPVAFVCMVLVTAFTTFLALSQNAEVLAAFALIGGFMTPALVSTGQNREITLFSYIVLLDVATLIFARQRRWIRLLPGAFFGTLALYVAWYASYYRSEHLAITFFFATLFFVIFAAPAVLIRSSEDAASSAVTPILTGVALVNAATYFLQGYVMLQEWDDTKPFTAWFAVGVAVVYLILAREIRASAAGKARDILTLLHITLAIVFLTIAIPLKLEAHWVTIGWLVEAALLMYVGQRTGTPLLKVLSTLALVLGVARLVFFDNFVSTRVLLNTRFATYVVAIVAIAFTAYLLRDSKSETERQGLAVAIVAINLLVLVAAHHEVNDYFNWQLEPLYRQSNTIDYTQWQKSHDINVTRQFTYSAVWMLYGALLMWVGFSRRSAFIRWQALILIAATIIKVFIFDVSSLNRGYRILAFIALGAILLGISFVYQRDWLKLSRRGEAA